MERYKFFNVKHAVQNSGEINITNICKNPKCQKEIPDTKTYCNEECLKEHLNVKKKNINESFIGLVTLTPEKIIEIDNICDVFGFKHTDGLVSGSHNATILGYLIMRQEEVYSTTVNKLTWICHMSARSLKENYLKGIEDFGIIETFINNFGVLKWRWIGAKALKNNGSNKEWMNLKYN